MNNIELLKKLRDEITELESKLKYKRLHNIRARILKSLTKGGIIIDHALPFILSAVLITNASFIRNSGLYDDEITEKAYIELIKTADGEELENITFDEERDKKFFQHTTGWKKDKNGLYERTITTYHIEKHLDATRANEILEMSQEELIESFIVTDVVTIKKSKLTEDDKIYTSEALILDYESEGETRVREKTWYETIGDGLILYILIMFAGTGIQKVEQIILRGTIRKKLKEYDSLLTVLTKKDIETLRRILQLKRENLSLLEENTEKDYVYQIKRKQGGK